MDHLNTGMYCNISIVVTVERTADTEKGYPREPTGIHVWQYPTYPVPTQANSQDQYRYGKAFLSYICFSLDSKI